MRLIVSKNTTKKISIKSITLAYGIFNVALLGAIYSVQNQSFWSLSTIGLVISAVIAISLLTYLTSPITNLKACLEKMAMSYEKIDVPTHYKNSEFGTLFGYISQISYNLDAINSTQAVIQFNLDGTIIEANENFLKTVGYGLDDIKGKHHRIFAYGDFAQTQEYVKFWQQLNNGIFSSGEYLRKGSNGQKIWLFAYYVPIFDLNGNPIRVVKFASDITKEVMQREATAQSQKEFELLSLVASETDNLVIITDANERIEYVNNGFTRLTGYTAEEVVGKRPTFLQGVDTTNEMKNEIRKKVATKQPFYQEMLNYTKHQKPYWVSLVVNPILDDAGNVIRFVSIQGDITTIKKARLEDEMGQAEAIQVLSALSEGDLNLRMNGDYKGTFLNIKNTINQTIDQLGSITSNISQSSNDMNDRSRNILDASDNLSGRTESQAATLEEINATMTEINTTVTKNSDLAAQSSDFAGEVRQTALNGGEVLKNLMTSMGDISESSERIVDIIGLIDTIASQTNLLALNAAVEAARAGEAGHGFAVVAGEVRTLAGRAAEASSDIRKLIIENAARISSGSSLATNAGRSLNEIVNSVSLLADQVDDIHKATKEQTTAIREISSALNSMDSATQKNSQMAVQTSAIAQELQNLGADLNMHVDFFKKDTTKASFIRKIA
ncbi:MAG: methyl-accepting chemotaxis protein [Alphaproteobacteria bacterium]|jgi:methyl-accepting chemotaxis protein